MRLRLLMLVPVLLVSLWWALSVRQAHDTARALATVELGGPARDPGYIRSLLSSAATLNPDAEIDILRARLNIKQGSPATARGILQAVTRREPQNLEGWIWLAAASFDDRSEAQRALAQIRALDPRDRG